MLIGVLNKALQARWGLLDFHVDNWLLTPFLGIMYTSIIMNNMIIQDKRGVVVEPCFEPLEESGFKEGESTSTGFGDGSSTWLDFLAFAIGNCTN